MMTRRQFAMVFAAVAPGPGVVLEAIAGPRIPHRLRIRGIASNDLRIFELRVCQSPVPLLPIFTRNGIQKAGRWPAPPGEVRQATGLPWPYLFTFESLTARERAWAALNEDREWLGVREHVAVTHIAIYKVRQPGGRILEMSL